MLDGVAAAEERLALALAASAEEAGARVAELEGRIAARMRETLEGQGVAAQVPKRKRKNTCILRVFSRCAPVFFAMRERARA